MQATCGRRKHSQPEGLVALEPHHKDFESVDQRFVTLRVFGQIERNLQIVVKAFQAGQNHRDGVGARRGRRILLGQPGNRSGGAYQNGEGDAPNHFSDSFQRCRGCSTTVILTASLE